ncbi:MAG: hypothetical protein H6841_00065 [Planctomycetes bacterium]|nr:hypothetical protein [Planctomycetota bacterium]
MRRVLSAFICLCALGSAFLITGCGPGLVAAGGGSVGAIFGLSGSDKKKDKNPAPPPPSTNVVPAVVVTSLIREESPAAINYTILDANNDLCSVEVQYSVGGGAFQACFQGTGGDGTTGLASSAGGVPHVFEWDFATDLGPQVTTDITLRIRANDGSTAGSWATLANQTIGNEAPEILNIQGSGSDIVLFTFDLADQNSDLGTLEVFYSIDQGQNFIPVDTDPLSPTYELIGNPPTGLLTSQAGSPGQFIWAAPLSLYDFVGDVLIQLRPKDQPSGYSAETLGSPIVAGPFSIDTSVNGPPTLQLISNLDGLSFTGKVPLNITLHDEESNASVVGVQFTFDGSTWFPATLETQFASGVAGPFLTTPSPTGYSIVWDALADIGQITPWSNNYPTVVLALTPADATSGTTVVTNVFSLVGNEEPAVLDVQALQDSGNIPIVVTVQDAQSDPVSVSIEYSTDSVNYTALSAADFVFGNPSNLGSNPVGEQNVLVWNSNIAFPAANAAAVTLRVTPTDHPPSATPTADLTGAPFVSAPFPVINDPSGAAPISIDVFTTDAGGTPNAVDDVTVVASGLVYFDRTINPASATVTSTLWKIFQTGADYGTLLTVGGGPLQYSQGSVTVSASVSDGNTFTIDDGINGPETFEFDSNSLFQVNTVPVPIGGLTTQDEFGQALTDAVNANPDVRITATYAGSGVIQFKHEIACNIGNAASVALGGNATDMAFTGGAGVIGTQMNGGNGTQRVLYQAPASPPAGSEYVTLYCEIDDPAYFTTVRKSYKLWWGTKPTGVTVLPASASLLVGGSQQFTAEVANLATAPQFVTWEVVGGSVNGTVSASGLYAAPSTLPNSNPVTVRASCVDPSVAPGVASITVQPEPTNVLVSAPANNPPVWVNPDLRLGTSITFSASVSPAAAPQGVNWRVYWNSQDWGSGNSTVGTISASGTYTAPQFLPSPDIVRIDAVSQAKPTVFGSFFVHLVAPPPTSFVVSPNTASVFAGGAGVQFNATNFVPANANQAVTWEINPVVGNISGSGFYTPPATSPAVQVVTVTARSAVDTMISATATVTVNPGASTAPTGVVIAPGEGITISRSQFSSPIQFSATVSPPAASQNVTWTFVGPGFGSLTQGGLYTPDPTAIDRVITIRATANASPNPFDEVDICITGDGQNWSEIGNFTMGRGDASPVWDPVNDRLWIVGGHSETSPSNHEEVPVYLSLASTPAIGAYSGISAGGGFPKAASAIMGVCDVTNSRLLAVVAQGASDYALVYSLDLTNVTGATPASWQLVSAGGITNAPKLDGTFHYHCWWDPVSEELQLLGDKGTLYRFSTDQGGSTPDDWVSVVTLQQPALAPVDPKLVAHAYDDTNNVHYFVGAEDGTAGAANKVWSLSYTNWKWQVVPSVGSPPGKGLVNCSAYFHNSNIYVFGGRESDKAGYHSDLYTVAITANANWTKVVNTTERPLPRGDAAFALAGFNGAYLFGGELPLKGSFGDLWFFDEGNGEFWPENADNIRPQGRKFAAGAFGLGEGVIFGGLCDHGVSNETWVVDFAQVSGTATWTRISANGDLPPPLWGAAAVWDPVDDMMILYGGDQASGVTSDLVDKYWAFDPSSDTWTDLGTGPGKRREAAMCYDIANDRIWMFGGRDDSGNRKNDLWYLNLSGGLPGNWVQCTTLVGTPPDPRTNATIGYDTRNSRLLVCGGDSSVSGPNRQLHAFTPVTSTTGNWGSLSILNTGSEENVSLSAGVYDDDCSRILHAPATRAKAQAVVIGTNGPVWQYLTPPVNNNTTAATGLYDPATGRYYTLFGERTISGRPIGTNAFRTFLLK